MTDRKVNKTILRAYRDVIKSHEKAGKDTSVAKKRMNHLISEQKKMK